MVYGLKIAYRGTAYAGWQRQPNALSVQEVVENALGDLLRRPVRVVGASRTDAGVHARGQVSHLELDSDFPERGLLHGGNQRLPEDVRILEAFRVAPGFHARKSALGKEYRYRLIRANVLSPLDSLFAVRLTYPIDLEAMRKATEMLVGDHDFSAFALSGGGHRSSRREIFAAAWFEQGAELELRIAGRGFLRGMVRTIVGTLLEVGGGRRSEASFEALLSGGNRSSAGPTARARGLILQRVEYESKWILDDSSVGVL